ncbi:hypothetical protein HDA32_003441 [Spinactinospora alkalitolerans]|uniref:Uncharacterized protein n=1 Tax=Spinactinospora alkalitolerans TaxID=687207 RepID=A0A852TX64_9ACTN|nr:hypothetical protein [Spinactinospora alkalitolerans]NYE48321.1 hypothetical protein [Spinactinospora alkalitolerans]
MNAVPGYHLSPSDDVRRLRADFPDYLICELHDEHGRPRFTATRTAPAVSGAAELIIAPEAEALRARLAVQPTTPRLPNRGGERS